MKTLIIENTWLPNMEHGWGNGYVLIPKGHTAHGKDYDHIDVDVHGGLTFGAEIDSDMVESWGNGGLTKEDIGSWCVGFDTAHYHDNIQRWPKEAVQAEADRLKEQLLTL